MTPKIRDAWQSRHENKKYKNSRMLFFSFFFTIGAQLSSNVYDTSLKWSFACMFFFFWLLHVDFLYQPFSLICTMGQTFTVTVHFFNDSYYFLKGECCVCILLGFMFRFHFLS